MLGQFWFVDAKGQQQQGVGLDAAMAAIARGDLQQGSNFYDPVLGTWMVASQVPELSGRFWTGTGVATPSPMAPALAKESPVFKVLTVLFLVGAMFFGYTYESMGGASGGYLVGTLIAAPVMLWILGTLIIKFAKPRRRGLVWMSVAFFLLFVQMSKLGGRMKEQEAGRMTSSGTVP